MSYCSASAQLHCQAPVENHSPQLGGAVYVSEVPYSHKFAVFTLVFTASFGLGRSFMVSLFYTFFTFSPTHER